MHFFSSREQGVGSPAQIVAVDPESFKQWSKTKQVVCFPLCNLLASPSTSVHGAAGWWTGFLNISGFKCPLLQPQIAFGTDQFPSPVLDVAASTYSRATQWAVQLLGWFCCLEKYPSICPQPQKWMGKGSFMKGLYFYNCQLVCVLDRSVNQHRLKMQHAAEEPRSAT